MRTADTTDACSSRMSSSLKWYAANTRAGQVLSVKARLDRLGVENFIPLRDAYKIRGGRRVKAQEPIAGTLVFIHADKDKALALANGYEFPLWYLIDATTRSLLEVPDRQMSDFMRVVLEEPSAEYLTDCHYRKGQRVRIVKGNLSGVEGTVLKEKGKAYLMVQVLSFLTARVQVSKDMVEPVQM